MLIPHSVNSDWLFSTLSRVLQANWFTLEINEKVTLNINMPYWKCLSNHGKAVKIIINGLYVLLKPCCGLNTQVSRKKMQQSEKKSNLH